MTTDCTYLLHDGEELFDKLRATQCTHMVTALEQLGARRLLLRIKPYEAAINNRGNVFIGRFVWQECFIIV